MLFSLLTNKLPGKLRQHLTAGILLICSLLSLTGCVNVHMQTNVRPEAKPDFKRILIVSNLPQIRATYLPTFQTAFPAGYQVCIVESGPLSFDSPEEAIARQRQTCRSEVLLTIDFNRNYTTGYGKYITSTNELLMEMSNLATGQSFWKALVVTTTGNEVPPHQVVQQLIKDGIIEGSAPLEKSYRSDY